MKKEIADKWIAALRSGKYVQGRSYLRTTDDKFCCLGVLCDLLHPQEWVEVEGDMDRCYCLQDGGSTVDAVLPLSVQKETGIHSSGGDLPNQDQGALWQLNDLEKFSFTKIADVIEEHWEYL